MKTIVFFVSAVLSLLLTLESAQAAKQERFQSLVTLSNKQVVYLDYMYPTQKNARTIILLNGLTYNTENWDHLVETIQDLGFGILRYDMRGMGKTFDANGPVTKPIPYMSQVEDLKTLIKDMKFKEKPILMGLSYGGGIGLAFTAQYPKLVEHTVLLAPYTKPLDGQDKMFKAIISQENMVRSFFFMPTLDPEQAYSDLLKKNVHEVYPLIEPGSWNPDAVFNLTEGIRVWNALIDPKVIALQDKRKITLVAAVLDQYVEYNTLVTLAGILEKNGSLNRFEKVWSDHKIPESNPYILDQLLQDIFTELKIN